MWLHIPVQHNRLKLWCSRSRLEICFLLTKLVKNRGFCTEVTKVDGRTSRKLSLFENWHYSHEQQNRVLMVLNSASEEQLQRYSISQNRAAQLQRYRRKQGPFQGLSNVLDVDGFGVKVLERLCDSILYGTEKKKARNSIKNHNGMVPVLSDEQLQKVCCAVGIQTTLQMVSWAALQRDGTLCHWNYDTWPLGSRRVDLTQICDIVQKIVSKLPKGEVYLLEESVFLPPQLPFASYQVHLAQAKAAMLALLNSNRESNHTNSPQVVTLKPSLITRTFGTQIGVERVSGQTVVDDLLHGVQRCSAVKELRIEEGARDVYDSQAPEAKEMMCQALFLPLTFWEASLRKN